MGMYAYLQGLYVIGISLGLRWPELCLRCNTGSDTDVRRLPSNVLRWEARVSSGLGLGWDGVSKCEKRLRKEPKNLTAAFHQASLRPPMASLALQTPGGERLESGFCIHGSWPPASRKREGAQLVVEPRDQGVFARRGKGTAFSFGCVEWERVFQTSFLVISLN